MLTKLTLQNFRGFENHKLRFRPTTIIVGRNNAGKTTIVEALRLISFATERYCRSRYTNAPAWTGVPSWQRGFNLSISGIEFQYDTVFHRYGDPPAVITATFGNRSVATVYIGPESQVFTTIQSGTGRFAGSASESSRVHIPLVQTMPQVAPLQREETVLVPSYVRGAMSSSLAPLHFRNQINLLYENFRDLQRLAEETWRGFSIEELRGRGSAHGSDLHLWVRDSDFVGEIGCMGHGIQMWLQTMWFLVRTKAEATVILDEPDVYMHADLQRKLIRLLKNRYHQTIVATHSIEIMSEVEPHEVLIVDRAKSESNFADSLPIVQSVMNNIGAVQNLQLTRLWRSRRCILVEGDDIAILKRLQNTLFPNSQEPLDAIPNMPIGGRGAWNSAIATAKFARNALGEHVTIYCILDSDYYTKEENDDRLNEASENGIQLYIWERKEIENYLLVPEAIQRFIASKTKKDILPDVDTIRHQMGSITDQLYDTVFDGISSAFRMKYKDKQDSANRYAREIIENKWSTLDGRLSLVSGKDMLSKLSAWSKDEYKVSFGVGRIAQELKKDEIALEVQSVITAIEQSTL